MDGRQEATKNYTEGCGNFEREGGLLGRGVRTLAGAARRTEQGNVHAAAATFMVAPTACAKRSSGGEKCGERAHFTLEWFNVVLKEYIRSNREEVFLFPLLHQDARVS